MTRTLRNHDHHLDHGDQDYGGDDRPVVDPVAARLMFDAAVDQLTAPGVQTITRDDGTGERGLVPCLLDQLAAATRPGSERTGGTASGSRPPASMNALAVVAEIGTTMRHALAALGHDLFGPAPKTALSTQVRLWASHAEHWQHHDPDYLHHAATETQRWVTAARAVIEPEPRYRLRGHACPVCAETTVHVWSDVESDWVRQPALSIDTDRVEAVCGACATTWGLDVWAQLGRILHTQHQETLHLDCE
ncbi:DUF7341 domain-containing protein [Actinokineospora iranica]|uniref:Uncharacterized protein n=1 Tax=Actinokineospora iranica TaxID=1271860 RepID=A0A1G6K2S9_9PSEU|nr:hypothetical protein [Actinokineospora iranica]SDC25198.1 hypothetical protein SAMN05216174_101682 [Actinokineospora iranica]